MKNLLIVATLFLASCGGGSNNLEQFEYGLVGSYELLRVRGSGFDLVPQEGEARLGEMVLQDDHSYEKRFNGDASDALGYLYETGNWSATLSTIMFDDNLVAWDSNNSAGTGPEIGEMLYIDDFNNDIYYVWLKIARAPSNGN